METSAADTDSAVARRLPNKIAKLKCCINNSPRASEQNELMKYKYISYVLLYGRAGGRGDDDGTITYRVQNRRTKNARERYLVCTSDSHKALLVRGLCHHNPQSSADMFVLYELYNRTELYLTWSDSRIEIVRVRVCTSVRVYVTIAIRRRQLSWRWNFKSAQLVSAQS